MLYRWVVEERCRLIVLLGMGGIGKTALSVKLAQQIVGRGDEEVPALLSPPASLCPFRFVIWRSLRNAPPLETLLAELVPFLAQQQDTQASLSRLIYWLRSHRCLIILDNLETLLEPGQVGTFRQGYEDYGELLRLGAETSHQSCVLLTSRESPTDVTIFAGQQLPVRLLRLSGSAEAAQAILQAKGLVGTPQQRHLLGNRYANSPLALKMIATSIQSLFDGSIATFLQENTLVFSGIRRLLDQQFDRLSPLEQSIMFWLAINREWTTIDEIHKDILPTVSRSRVLEALEYLTERSLLEKQTDSYTQQPVVMEYVTERLIEQITDELSNINLNLFNTHTLVKATAKDYIRQTQICLILQPILNCLDNPEEQLATLLQVLRNQSQWSSGYSAGNLLNLLCHSDFDISNYDFSHLTIRQAYLKSRHLHHINFANAHFTNAVLTYNFGSILAVAFSSDGKLLATGDSNQNINLWHVADGRSLAIYQGHTDWVWSVAFSPDGEILASGSDDQTVRLWDVRTQQCLRVLHEHTKQVWSVAFSLSGEILASGSDDQTIRLWDVRTRQCLHVLQGHTKGVWTVAFSPDGGMLVSGSEDQTIRLWDMKTQQCLHVFQGHTSWVRSVAFSPNGETIASGSEDQTIRLWNTKTGQCLHVLQGHTNQVMSVAFSPNGETIASGSDDQTVRLWNVRTGQCLHVLQGHTNRVCAIALALTRLSAVTSG
ncbi:MAG: NACHT domain-containing protein [Cyanobacteria bacterium CRU_2_1]|nr:NACHT domain-containing protein [Cyanobacteria bacterium CRU_2_1]